MVTSNADELFVFTPVVWLITFSSFGSSLIMPGAVGVSGRAALLPKLWLRVLLTGPVDGSRTGAGVVSGTGIVPSCTRMKFKKVWSSRKILGAKGFRGVLTVARKGPITCSSGKRARWRSCVPMFLC